MRTCWVRLFVRTYGNLQYNDAPPWLHFSGVDPSFGTTVLTLALLLPSPQALGIFCGPSCTVLLLTTWITGNQVLRVRRLSIVTQIIFSGSILENAMDYGNQVETYSIVRTRGQKFSLTIKYESKLCCGTTPKSLPSLA